MMSDVRVVGFENITAAVTAIVQYQADSFKVWVPWQQYSVPCGYYKLELRGPASAAFEIGECKAGVTTIKLEERDHLFDAASPKDVQRHPRLIQVWASVSIHFFSRAEGKAEVGGGIEQQCSVIVTPWVDDYSGQNPRRVFLTPENYDLVVVSPEGVSVENAGNAWRLLSDRAHPLVKYRAVNKHGGPSREYDEPLGKSCVEHVPAPKRPTVATQGGTSHYESSISTFSFLDEMFSPDIEGHSWFLLGGTHYEVDATSEGANAWALSLGGGWENRYLVTGATVGGGMAFGDEQSHLFGAVDAHLALSPHLGRNFALMIGANAEAWSMSEGDGGFGAAASDGGNGAGLGALVGAKLHYQYTSGGGSVGFAVRLPAIGDGLFSVSLNLGAY
jgi:hypothetical protein